MELFLLPFSKLSELPDNIQKLPKPKQEQFMAAFNTFFADCGKEGGKDCEGRAMAVAHSAIKAKKDLKAIAVPDDIAEKDRGAYQEAYGAFHKECVKDGEKKPGECAEGADVAARVAIKKSPGKTLPEVDELWLKEYLIGKAGARNAASDQRHIQKIHDGSKALGADCFAMSGGEGKAMGLSEQERIVRRAWFKRFRRSISPPTEDGEGMPFFSVRIILDDRAIVQENSSGQLFSYPYTIENRMVEFGEPVQVEMTFVETKEGAPGSKKSIEIKYTCAIEGHEHACKKSASDCIAVTSLNTPGVRAEFCKSPHCSNALKTISETPDELVVANYIILFGGRDLEGLASHRINKNGSKGEYFTKATEVESEYTNTGRLLVDWEHGRAPEDAEPGRDDVLGYVDWKSAIVDEEGIFVRRVLNRRNKYVKFLEKLIRAGMIGTSSEPVQSQIAKATDGRIEIWPFKRDTLTVAPMDPRMMNQNSLDLIKSLAGEPGFNPVFEQVFNVNASVAEAELLLIQIGEN